MLSSEEIRELAKVQPGDGYTVSLYLNVDPVTNPGGEHIIRYKNMVKDTVEGLDKQVAKRIKDDVSAMDAYVLGNKREFKKGLCMLSSGARGLFRAYNFSVPVKSEVVVDKAPYIKPLMDILDNYERYAVLLLDKESARIFVVHLGEMTEYGEVHTEGVPGKQKGGGWFALSQDRFDRHVDYHVGMHMKDVVGRLESFMKGEMVKRLIIGGSDEAVSMVKGLLPRPLTEEIIGSFQAGMYEAGVDVLKKVEPVVRAHEGEREKASVGELITRAEKKERAVLGLEASLNAIEEGKVMRLVFERDFKSPGYACKSCKALSSQDIKACPYCKGPMEGVAYLVELMAQKAVEQGAAVEVVGEGSGLSKKGKIGAILRF